MNSQNVFKNTQSIILASSSPRRLELLSSMGINFACIPPKGMEPTPHEHEQPLKYAIRAANAKLTSLTADYPDSVIVAADTIVTLNDIIFGKPCNNAESLDMLKLLAGNKHQVITALCIYVPRQGCHTLYDIAEVNMFMWSEEVLQAYALTGESLDKAGAYAIQGKGAFLIESICGSWTTVVGLPLTLLLDFLILNNIIYSSN